MKNPASVIKFGLFFVIAIIVYNQFNSTEPPPPVGNGPTIANLPTSEIPSGSRAFSLEPLKANWPPLDSVQQDNVVLAQDLLASNYYIVLDGSGSMRDVECSEGLPKMDVAKNALTTFAQSLPPNVNLGLLAFDNEGVSERVPLGPNNQQAFTQAVSNVVANRGTPLGSAIGKAYAKLETQARSQLGYGEYHLVIITDGKASRNEDPTPVVNQILNNAPIVFHTIGFCIGERHSLNQPGRTYYQSANDPSALSKGLQNVLAEAPDFSVSTFSQ